MLSLPLSRWISRAVLSGDDLAPGERLRPVERTERRLWRGRSEAVWREAVYSAAGLTEGTVLVVTEAGRSVPGQAFVLRDGEPVEVTVAEAEDLLDPPGARRRAWQRRLLGTLLTATPRRYRYEPGHGYEADVVYDWHGTPDVAACVRATERYVWWRAVTYEEALALGVA